MRAASTRAPCNDRWEIGRTAGVQRWRVAIRDSRSSCSTSACPRPSRRSLEGARAPVAGLLLDQLLDGDLAPHGCSAVSTRTPGQRLNLLLLMGSRAVPDALMPRHAHATPSARSSYGGGRGVGGGGGVGGPRGKPERPPRSARRRAHSARSVQRRRRAVDPVPAAPLAHHGPEEHEPGRLPGRDQEQQRDRARSAASRQMTPSLRSRASRTGGSAGRACGWRRSRPPGPCCS